MKRHLAYLRYVLRHKWYVYRACRVCGVGLRQALVHDWTKFLPSEWGPYARTFYNTDGSKRYLESPEFSVAWRHHQRRNPHHWQYWLITWDRGTTEPLPMPERYWREMAADWLGAGRAITGKWDAVAWYEKNQSAIQLQPGTRELVTALLSKAQAELTDMDRDPTWVRAQPNP